MSTREHSDAACQTDTSNVGKIESSAYNLKIFKSWLNRKVQNFNNQRSKFQELFEKDGEFKLLPVYYIPGEFPLHDTYCAELMNKITESKDPIIQQYSRSFRKYFSEVNALMQISGIESDSDRLQTQTTRKKRQ